MCVACQPSSPDLRLTSTNMAPSQQSNSMVTFEHCICTTSLQCNMNAACIAAAHNHHCCISAATPHRNTPHRVAKIHTATSWPPRKRSRVHTQKQKCAASENRLPNPSIQGTAENSTCNHASRGKECHTSKLTFHLQSK